MGVRNDGAPLTGRRGIQPFNLQGAGLEIKGLFDHGTLLYHPILDNPVMCVLASDKMLNAHDSSFQVEALPDHIYPS